MHFWISAVYRIWYCSYSWKETQQKVICSKYESKELHSINTRNPSAEPAAVSYSALLSAEKNSKSYWDTAKKQRKILKVRYWDTGKNHSFCLACHQWFSLKMLSFTNHRLSCFSVEICYNCTGKLGPVLLWGDPSFPNVTAMKSGQIF